MYISQALVPGWGPRQNPANSGEYKCEIHLGRNKQNSPACMVAEGELRGFGLMGACGTEPDGCWHQVQCPVVLSKHKNGSGKLSFC